MSNTGIQEWDKDNIRNRMIKNAARISNVEGDDIEATFDPIVLMMIEACAFELNKINNEIVDSQSRILERLAQVLSPDTFTGAQPAYAVAHARAADPESTLRREVQMYAQQTTLTPDQKEITNDIYFSPVSRTTIFDAAIKYMVTGKSIYEYKTPLSKQLIAEGKPGESVEPFHAWIGIELNPKIKSLNNFVFYFNEKNNREKENYLSLLPLTKWFFNQQELKSVNGCMQDHSAELKLKSISEQYDVSLGTEKFVTRFFSENFVTLHCDDSISLQSHLHNVPPELEQVFPKNALDKIEGKCAWLKLVFPGAMKLNNLHISINSFPVINRRVNKITYQLRSNLNIVPLKTDEIFFDIINIQNSDGNFFQSNPLESGFKNEAGYYTLRYGGIERFDKRGATEFLQTTIDLLRDESASFSSLGNEFIYSYINQINQAIAMIENRLGSKGEIVKPSHFIIINPLKQNENVFIKFWSTCGTEGNQIQAGTKLTLSSGAVTKSAALMLLTTSTGGKRALNENEKVAAFKRSILTHNRIITQEDIVTLCYHELNNLVSKIEIKRNWHQSNLPKQAMIRIVEVHITPKQFQKISDEEWQNLAKELKVKIESSSGNLIPVKVIIHNQE
jgi:type VI secretion system (T6SS) ImpG/VasA family protein